MKQRAVRNNGSVAIRGTVQVIGFREIEGDAAHFTAVLGAYEDCTIDQSKGEPVFPVALAIRLPIAWAERFPMDSRFRLRLTGDLSQRTAEPCFDFEHCDETSVSYVGTAESST
jgi:hypothetical protein